MRSLNNYLLGFTGTENYYVFSRLFPDIYLTDGTKYAADKYRLYWFIDVIGSYQAEGKTKNEPFQAWTLERTVKDTFVVTADDGNGNLLQSQGIEYSDFEMDHFKVYLVDNIILLPSEN